MLTGTRWAWLAVAAMTCLFAVRCHGTYHVFNDTIDEAIHIASGLELWQTGKYTINIRHPPLARAAIALPPYLGGLRETWPEPLWSGTFRETYWRALALARCGNLVFVPFLLGYVFLWGKQLYGPEAGLAAALVASLCPNLLGHASLATVDFGEVAAGFVCAYYAWRWSEEPTPRNAAVAGATFGVALLVKFSAAGFLPAVALLFFLAAQRRKARPWFLAIQHAALALAVAALVVWTGYRFDFGPLPDAMFSPAPGTFVQRVVSLAQILASHGAPAPAFVRGLLDVLVLDARGYPSYFLGEIRTTGWWYYFPVALALKTTIPLLLLAALGLAARPAASPALAAAVILLIAMRSTLDLGIRYILIIYPFLALIGAAVFAERGRRALLAVAAALVAWHAVESLRASPDYLAYFNQIARGREERFLLDSNLDWGQDLERLRRYTEDHHISTIYLSYFGRTDPRLLGMTGARPLPAGLRPGGWVAVSKNHLGGIGRDKAELGWLSGHKPVDSAGKSILLFHLPGPG